MTATAARLPRWHSLRGEDRVFGAALAVLALQVVVEGVLAGGAAHLAVTAAAPSVALLLLMLFERSGRIIRTLTAGLLGLLAAAFGFAVHVARLALGRPEAGDYTGVLLAIAGVALIALAFHVAFHDTRRRVKLLALPVALILLQWYAVPVMQAGVVTNAQRPSVAGAATLGLAGARDVGFPARDGTQLAAWYVPGRNGAAVILLHGSHGDRADTTGYLRMLSRAGYAVLAFDARGHGDSSGQTNALGWQGGDDVDGAVVFLRRQAGVDPRRIAALGLSMGGEEALRAASQGVRLRAVIADGAGASTTGDSRLTQGAPIPLSVSWVTMRVTELFSGEAEPAALAEIVSGIRAPVLLIASGRTDELATDRAYRDRIGKRTTLWYVADSGHTEAFANHPTAYAARVRAFLESALFPR